MSEDYYQIGELVLLNVSDILTFSNCICIVLGYKYRLNSRLTEDLLLLNGHKITRIPDYMWKYVSKL